MDIIRATAAIMTLGFVAVTHLIGFNNVRVFKFFWIPEFVLLLYVFYTIIPFEKIPDLVHKLKTPLKKRRSQRKVVKIDSIWKRVSLPVVFDGVLITAVASLSLYLLYRL